MVCMRAGGMFTGGGNVGVEGGDMSREGVCPEGEGWVYHGTWDTPGTPSGNHQNT